MFSGCSKRTDDIWFEREAVTGIQTSDESWSRDATGKPEDDLAPGTLNSIFKQAGLKKE
jgi:hypothetical protein